MNFSMVQRQKTNFFIVQERNFFFDKAEEPKWYYFIPNFIFNFLCSIAWHKDRDFELN